MNGSSSRAAPARWASPTTPRKSSATSSSSTCPGAAVEAGKPLGSVESVKAVSDIYSPVTGEVIEVNELLAAAPEKLNEDPHGAAWLVRIRLSNPAELDGLMSAAEYEAYLGG